MFLKMTTEAKFSKPAYLAPAKFAVVQVNRLSGAVHTLAKFSSVSDANRYMLSLARGAAFSYFVEVL